MSNKRSAGKVAKRNRSAEGAPATPKKPKPSATVGSRRQPATRRYSDSLGAASTHEDSRRLAERNLYNSVDYRLQGKAFDDIPRWEFAALKHQACLMYQGAIVWSQLAEDYRDGACALIGLEGQYDHPIWTGVFRHAMIAPSKVAGDKFVSDCLGQDLTNFDWMATSETVRGEWCLFEYMYSAVQPQAFKDPALLKAWFPTADFREAVVLAAISLAMMMNQVAEIEQCLTLLEDLDPLSKVVAPDGLIPAAFISLTARARVRAARSDYVGAECTLSEGWNALNALKSAEPHAVWWLEQMKRIRDQRNEYCKILQDENGREKAAKDWRHALELALETFSEDSH